jgi:hypothetical protein
MFNAKVVLKNGVLIFERRDYNTSTTLYQVPDLRNDYHQLNTADMKATYLLSFQTDLNDKNTIERYKGVSYQATTLPVIVNDPKYLLLKNLEQALIPFALGKRKETLTVPEVILSNVIDIINIPLNLMGVIINGAIDGINAIIEVVNNLFDAIATIGPDLGVDIPTIPPFNPPTIANPISNRIGMMLLENDYIDTPKLVMIDEGSEPKNTKVTTNNETFLSAKQLWLDFHYINSFVELNGKHNQWKKYNYTGVPFSFNDYLLVKDDNKITTPDGSVAELLSLKWNIYDQIADIRFRVNEKYTNNLQLKTYEPDGN